MSKKEKKSGSHTEAEKLQMPSKHLPFLKI